MVAAVDAREIVDGFGLLGQQLELAAIARGAVGRVWRLDVGGGRRYAVKEFLWGADPGSARREIAFRDLAAASGVRSPASLSTVEGLPVLLCGDKSVRLYEWIDGTVVDPREPDVCAWLGATIATLHKLSFRVARDPDPWYEEVPGAEAWAKLVSTDASWSRKLRRSLDCITELSELVSVADRRALVMCHLDLAPMNVLRDVSGRIVLLDWDDAGPAAPDRNLASTLIAWHVRHRRVDVAGVRGTVAAYRQSGGPATLTRDSFAMHCATSLNYLYVQAALSLDVSQPGDERRRASGEVTRSLVTLVSPELIDSVVEAAM